MALFRKKTTTTEIPELQEYYAAKRANNSVGAWVMALVSLIITVLIILALFYGGRWIWRKIQGDDNNVTTTVQQTGDEINEDLDEAVEGDNNGETSESGTATEGESHDDGDETHEEGDDHSDESGSTSEMGSTGTSSTSTTTPSGSGSSTSSSDSSSTPATGGSETTTTTTESLPNSGPGDVVAIFAVSTAAGYAVHRYRTIKKQG